MRPIPALRLVLLFATSCAPSTRTVVIGAGAPSRPEGCPVRDEAITPAEAGARYRQIGAICWSTTNRWDLEKNVCRLGGNVVVRSGLCTNGSGRFSESGVEYGVYLDGPAD